MRRFVGVPLAVTRFVYYSKTDRPPERVYPPGMSLGDELRNAREAADLTQEQVAAAAGIDRAYLSLLENNHKSPTVDTLFRICKALGVPASQILARVEQAKQPEAD